MKSSHLSAGALMLAVCFACPAMAQEAVQEQDNAQTEKLANDQPAIAWLPTAGLTGGDEDTTNDILTDGTYEIAVNVGPEDSTRNATIQGVKFFTDQAENTSGSKVTVKVETDAKGTLNGGHTEKDKLFSGRYQWSLMSPGAISGWHTDAHVMVTLNGLTVGKKYRVQFLASDKGGKFANHFQALDADTAKAPIKGTEYALSPGKGYGDVCTFVAAADQQVFTVSNSFDTDPDKKRSIVNAISVYSLGE